MSRPYRLLRILALGCLVVVSVAWNAALGSRSLLSELVPPRQLLHALTLTEEERFSDALRKLERQAGFEAGELTLLRTALRDEVRSDETVLVFAPPRNHRRKAITRLGVLLFPLQFAELIEIPPNGPPDPSIISESLLILDLAPFPRSRLEEWFRLVAEGPSFRLWRGKSEENR